MSEVKGGYRGFPVKAPGVAFDVGDLDGDGDLDVAACFNFDIRFYLNDGFGFFKEVKGPGIPAALAQYFLKLCDVDGDGDLDVLTGGLTYNFQGGFGPNRLYINKGKMVFADETWKRIPARFEYWFAMETSDFDGNGAPDLLVSTDRGMRILFNDGRGFFGWGAIPGLPLFSNGGYPRRFAVGDIDGDGDKDVVVGWERTLRPDRVAVLINNGKGIFSVSTPSPLVLFSSITSFALGDLNNDGRLDCVFVGDGKPQVLIHSPSGGLQFKTKGTLPPDLPKATQEKVFLWDLDGDGDLDIFLSSKKDYAPPPKFYFWEYQRYYENDGKGVFKDSTKAVLGNVILTRASRAADFDGDGDSDLVCTQWGLVIGNNVIRRNWRFYANLNQQLVMPVDARWNAPFKALFFAGEKSMEWLFLSTGTSRMNFPPFGALLLDPRYMVCRPFVIVPAGGSAAVQINVPFLGPWLRRLRIYGQGVSLNLKNQVVHFTNGDSTLLRL